MGQVRIEGEVAQPFQAVRDLYERNMNNLIERNTQLCVYVRGEKVVDLWGSACDDAEFGPDSLVNIFSSGKSFEAIAMAWLADQGHIDLNARVVRYWPEFGAHDKDNCRVSDLMRHESGLASFGVSMPPHSLLPENLKQNAAGQLIEQQQPRFRKQGRREYHAITRGWIANEIFRRVDPAGRTIGEFLREEINAPLAVDVQCGLATEDLDRRSPVVPVPVGQYVAEGLKPAIMGRKVDRHLFTTLRRLRPVFSNLRSRGRTRPPAPYEGMKAIADFNKDAIAQGETPSANTHSNARSLARVAAAMAGGGSLDSQTILSDKGWQILHGDPVTDRMTFLSTTFTQAGVARFERQRAISSALDEGLHKGREGFYGWMGLGGSIFQWHPEKQIGFGYVPTSLNVIDIVNERAKAYQAAVMECVDATV